MPVTIDGTNGITNGGGYTGDGVSFADATPANTLVTTTTGRVGIGTASPGAKSDIYAGALGTTAGNTLDLAYVWGSTNNTSRLATRLVRTSNGSDWTTAALRLQAVVDVDNQAYIDMIPAGGTYGMAFGTGTGGTPSERMRIDSAGNVGIGTVSPSTRLTVQGPVDTTFGPNVFNTRLIGTSSATSGSAGSGISFMGFTTGSTSVSDLAFVSGIKENTTDANYAGALIFGTRPNGSGGGSMERMRITSDGKVLIGTTSLGANNVPTFFVNGALGGTGLAARQGTGGTSSGNVFNFWWTGTVAQLWVDNVNVGNISVTSDYRTKDHVETQIEPAIERVLQLRPVTYQIADYGTLFKADGKVREGFIAHELAEVVPSAVEGEKDDPKQIQSLRLDALCSVLTKAIQEQQAIIEDLRARLAAVEGAIA